MLKRKKDLIEAATFVSGLQAWFRSASDANVKSAIDDAENFIKIVGRVNQDFSIWGATTANSDDIISIGWLLAGYERIRSVTVIFQGHGKWRAVWNEPSGTEKSARGLSHKELVSLDIPYKVSKLKKFSKEKRYHIHK